MTEPISTCTRCAREGKRGRAVKGTTLCRMHGGTAPQVYRKGIVRAELSSWNLPDTALADPTNTLLRLITQGMARVEYYGRLIDQLHEELPLDASVQRRVELLIGHVYKSGGESVGVFESEEAIRGLVQLEAAERDRVARWCKMAIDAGVAAKQVEIAQAQAAMMYRLITASIEQAGLDHAVADQVLAVMPTVIRSSGYAVGA